MEKEELKRRLIRLKKDLVKKQKRFQKCERLVNARYHVQQKLHEQAKLMIVEKQGGCKVSTHVPTKVTFERGADDEPIAISSKEHKKNNIENPVMLKDDLKLHEKHSSSEESSVVSDKHCGKLSWSQSPHECSKLSQVSKATHYNPESVYDRNLTTPSLTNKLNVTYVIESGNHSGTSSVSINNQNSCRSQESCSSLNRLPSYRSEEIVIDTENNDSPVDNLQHGSLPGAFGESVNVCSRSDHKPNEVLKPLDSNEPAEEVQYCPQIVPNHDFHVVNSCSGGQLDESTSETKENLLFKEEILQQCVNTVATPEPLESESQKNRSQGNFSNSVTTGKDQQLDFNSSALVLDFEDKENTNLDISSGDGTQPGSLTSPGRQFEVDLANMSLLEFEEDMYSQVKSRKNRHKHSSSFDCDTITSLQKGMAPCDMSQNGKIRNRNKYSKTGRVRLSANENKKHCARSVQSMTGSDQLSHNKSIVSMMKAVFPILPYQRDAQLVEFMLPVEEFDELLASKTNSHKHHANPEMKQNLRDEYCTDCYLISSYSDVESQSNTQNSDHHTLNETKPVFSYHSSIKFQCDEPILNLSCDFNEKGRPQEIMLGHTAFKVLMWIRQGAGWKITKEWTLEQLEAECILSCHISGCHKWIFIWTTVQCYTRLTVASVDCNSNLLKVLWRTKELCTSSQRIYSLIMKSRELLIGSVTPSFKTQLMKVRLKQVINVTAGDVESTLLDSVEEELTSVLPIEELPDALLGVASFKLYIWNHVSGRLVHTLTTEQKIQSCSGVHHRQGVLFMSAITDSGMMGSMLAINPVNGRSQLFTLETTPKEKCTRLTDLFSNGKLLCGKGDDGSIRLWCAHTGRLVGYSHKKPLSSTVHLCQTRLLIITGKIINVYKV